MNPYILFLFEVVAGLQEHSYCLDPRFLLKARSHGAIFVNETVIKKWVVWMLMILFIWCDMIIAVTFVCATSHMNGFQTHSVGLQCTIHTRYESQSHCVNSFTKLH